MDLRIFCAVFLLVFGKSSAVQPPSGPPPTATLGDTSEELAKPRRPTDRLHPLGSLPDSVSLHSALTGYVYWMQRVSRIFPRQPVDTTNMHAIEEEGETVHKLLSTAINREERELGVTLDREKLAESVLKTLEKDMKVDTQTLLGLVLADSATGSQGARMFVSIALFTKMTQKMQKLQENFKQEPKFLKRVFKIMSASEIALDAMVESFKFVEKLEFGELSHHRYKRQICTGLPPMGGSPRRNIGGGFSHEGSMLIYENGRTTVTAKPHFNILPRPELTGGQAALEHRFESFPGTLSGHVTVNGQGQVQNAGVQIKIDL